MRLLRHIPLIARLLLGVIFLVFGLNGFLHFLPEPPMPAEAIAFIGGLNTGGHFFPFLKGIEVVSGLLLLGNRFVPLVLVILAPIIVNIVLFHLALAPNAVIVAILLTLEIYLAYIHRSAFAPLLRAKCPA